ncbi:hydrogen-translocating pyrophosphatase [Aureococcus anophagefferens]|uniref:H(+)-exporting diphosphatase n=1 Tax=Aureococcus anophagefferens TaxID=44056 RepID=A0ABR1GAE0_AURAN
MAGVDVFIFFCSGLGAVFALMNFYIIQQTKINPGAGFVNPNSPLNAVTAELKKVEDIHATIELGAKAFLRAEYTICVQFLLAFSVVLLILTSMGSPFEDGMFRDRRAADVGADLVGKVVHGLEEDDPKNPATIADNVGDNVGDVAGMGSDLFEYGRGDGARWSSARRIATHLKLQLISTTFLIVPFVVYLAKALLPESFEMDSVVSGTMTCSATGAAICVSVGALGGLLIGLVTEYYTSHSYQPVRECAYVCKQGAAVNMIYGLALGYKSAIIPVYTLAAIIYFAFSLADLYGVALAALGMLSTLATGLTIDGYGPVTDNAGGIAEMSLLPESVREKTDCLDAAGNTTAAIGKGFAIGSAALVSLALYGAFVVRLGITGASNVLQPLTFAALLVGANLPYWFSAMTMKSVGLAAAEMVQEVERQFKADPSLLDPNSSSLPDYDACVEISTKASLREMIAPAALVMLTPLVAGTFFGVQAVFGILTGGLVSGVQLAISMSNSGGAGQREEEVHLRRLRPGPGPPQEGRQRQLDARARRRGDGRHRRRPVQGHVRPALNILMKLMAILSLVFAQYFQSINNGKGLFNV